jgi:hypothetical protein
MACQAEAPGVVNAARLAVAARGYGATAFAWIMERRLVDLSWTNSNQIVQWLGRIDRLRALV